MLPSVVLPNGTLNDRKILRREKLYQGMNGRFVERFYLSQSESYIFKPLTNSAQIGKEVWIHEHILTDIPLIYPQIEAHSISSNPENNWMILEDLGTIYHAFDEEIAVKIVRWMACWHSLPINRIENDQLQGPKPFIEKIAEIILLQKEKVIETFPGYGISKRMLKFIYMLFENRPFSGLKVLSHGDLHLGNYGYAGDRIIVLDWEHTHINSPYWDLYHLLDISHPIFPKTITKSLRNRVLDFYLDETKEKRIEEERISFKQEYYLFSAVFSIWMLLLIESDLDQKEAKWSREQLLQQLRETVSNLVQCGEELLQKESTIKRHVTII